MGYRSEVAILVSFKDTDHRDEVLAAYAMDPRVQAHDVLNQWKKIDPEDDYPLLKFYETHTKWYESYDDVQAVHHLEHILQLFAEERGLPYGWLFIRVGEEDNDVERDESFHDEKEGDNMLECLLYKLSLHQSISLEV